MLGTTVRHLSFVLAAAALAAPAAAQKEIKIGVIYDLTGPFAAGGSEAAYLGNKIAIDMVNERGGVDGYRIRPIYADAQSKAEVAISETERLISQEKVDMLMGVFSSAHCVPMAQKTDAAKNFFWMNVCVASAVLKDKKLQYAFRPQVHSDQFGEALDVLHLVVEGKTNAEIELNLGISEKLSRSIGRNFPQAGCRFAG